MKSIRNKIALVVTAALAAAVGSAPVALADDHDHSPSTLTVEKRVGSVNNPNAGTVTGTGIDCGSDCKEVYRFEETCAYVGEGGNHNSGRTQCDEVLPQVTLQATPAAGFQFAGWSGGGCSGTGSCKPTFPDNDTTVVANYTQVQVRDTTPPTGVITAPSQGQILVGSTTLAASAADSQSGVKEVRFFLNGATGAYEVDKTAPYTAELNTKTLVGGDGDHIVYAVIVDNAGNTYETPARGFVVDNSAPVLSVDGLEYGDVTSNTRPTFTFSATDARAVTYSCSLGSAAFTKCDSPYTLPELTDGSHDIRIAATDAVGNTAIEQITFTVDTTGPAVKITSGPNGKTKIQKGKFAATFAFEPEMGEAGITYRCRMDQGAWTACTSPTTIKVKPGRHQFQVEAADAVGNEGASPATYDFEVVKKKRRK